MTYYWTALLIILGAALFPKASRPFAVVMLLNIVANETLISQGGHLDPWVSAVDGVAFIALAALSWFRERKWWAFMVAELAFAAVVVHAAYWTAHGFGLYFGQEYQVILCGAFIVSAAILAFGGYDGKRLVGSAWNSLSHAYHLRRRHVHSGPRPVPSHRKGEK